MTVVRVPGSVGLARWGIGGLAGWFFVLCWWGWWMGGLKCARLGDWSVVGSDGRCASGEFGRGKAGEAGGQLAPCRFLYIIVRKKNIPKQNKTKRHTRMRTIGSYHFVCLAAARAPSLHGKPMSRQFPRQFHVHAAVSLAESNVLSCLPSFLRHPQIAKGLVTRRMH